MMMISMSSRIYEIKMATTIFSCSLFLLLFCKLAESGEPLLLTRYIRGNQIETARRLSKVNLPGTNLESYSGFLTVDPQFNSNMFFWYFPGPKNSSPLNVYLYGGPGTSSLHGLFILNGPFKINREIKLVHRHYTWSSLSSILYVDNPVGTGFSFSEESLGYSKNQTDVANNLYTFLQQFYLLFPEKKSKELYLSGDSYAGKYIPAFGYKIHQENLVASSNINLTGMIIGNGYTDPKSLIKYGDHLYQVGLIDEIALEYFHKEEEKARQFIDQGKYEEALQVINNLVWSTNTNNISYFYNVTGFSSKTHILKASSPYPYYIKYLSQSKVRDALHCGSKNFIPFVHGKVWEKLQDDIMRSVKEWLEFLMDRGYRVLIYSSQLDLIVNCPSLSRFVSQLSWNGADRYANTPRTIWKTADYQDIAGYVRTVDDFHFVTVRGAGHNGPSDQPLAFYEMIRRFLTRKPIAINDQ